MIKKQYRKKLPTELVTELRGFNSPILVEKYTLNEEQIDIVLDEELTLYNLYEFQTLNEKQVDRAIKIGKHLNTLIICQRLTEKHIDKLITQVEREMDTLLEQHILNLDQVNFLIDSRKTSLVELYEHKQIGVLHYGYIGEYVDLGEDLEFGQLFGVYYTDTYLQTGCRIWHKAEIIELLPKLKKPLFKGLLENYEVTEEQLNKLVEFIKKEWRLN